MKVADAISITINCPELTPWPHLLGIQESWSVPEPESESDQYLLNNVADHRSPFLICLEMVSNH